jgi:disulfide bond formation protein DsbB
VRAICTGFFSSWWDYRWKLPRFIISMCSMNRLAYFRIWILGFVAVAILALQLKRLEPLVPALHILNSFMMVGFVERSWQTLAVERGWIFGNCNMDAGLPNWFQLDQWFPALFEVKAACGYTPFIIFNISMAEALMVASSLLLCLSLLCLVASFWPSREY